VEIKPLREYVLVKTNRPQELAHRWLEAQRNFQTAQVEMYEFIKDQEMSPRWRVGDKGVRDPECPCVDFDPSPPQLGDFRECQSDGHYLCKECKHYMGEKTTVFTETADTVGEYCDD